MQRTQSLLWGCDPFTTGIMTHQARSSRIFQAKNGSGLSPSTPLCCWGSMNTPERVFQPPPRGPKLRGPAAEQHTQMVTAHRANGHQARVKPAAEHAGDWCREPATRLASHLALATAPVAPPHQALIVLILLGQVVIEDTLSHSLWDRERMLCPMWAVGAGGQEPEIWMQGLPPPHRVG